MDEALTPRELSEIVVQYQPNRRSLFYMKQMTILS